MKEVLLARLADGKAVLEVVGMGYVGLPLAQHFVAAGHNVIGLDADIKRVLLLDSGKGYLKHICMDWLPVPLQSCKFIPTSSFIRTAEADAVVVCVPTPLTEHREPDLSYVRSASEHVAQTLHCGQLVVLESTTYPGTTEELILPILTASGLKVGQVLFLGVLSRTGSSGQQEVFRRLHTQSRRRSNFGLHRSRHYPVSTCLRTCGAREQTWGDRTLQAAGKYLSQCQHALVNKLNMLCDRMGLDVWEIIDAAATKPFGFMPFYPGPGLGGHCIPIVLFYLLWKAREYTFSLVSSNYPARSTRACLNTLCAE